jgi:hypothetical protein
VNKKYSKQLFRLFEKELLSRWPHFKKCKQRPELGRAYSWNIDGIGNVFLFLWTSPKGWEKFYCEFGWSPAPYPVKDRTDYRFPFLEPKSAFTKPEMIAGIQRLWDDNGTGGWQIPDPVESFNAMDYADDPEAGGMEFVRRVKEQAALTEEDAEKLVRPVVEDLFEKLQTHVMPYLLEYVAFARSRAQ